VGTEPPVHMITSDGESPQSKPAAELARLETEGKQSPMNVKFERAHGARRNANKFIQ